jgi:hypothetical protein
MAALAWARYAGSSCSTKPTFPHHPVRVELEGDLRGVLVRRQLAGRLCLAHELLDPRNPAAPQVGDPVLDAALAHPELRLGRRAEAAAGEDALLDVVEEAVVRRAEPLGWGRGRRRLVENQGGEDLERGVDRLELELLLQTIRSYEASSPEKIRAHAFRADMPATEVFEVADTVVVRPEPVSTVAA